MYNDGWGPDGSYNLDCQTATADGCWGHRDNILWPQGSSKVITGVGSVVQAPWTSIAQIFVGGAGPYPPFTFAWSDVTGDVPDPTVDTTAAAVDGPSVVVAGHTVRIVGSLTTSAGGTQGREAQLGGP